ncbi:hypothetical protein L083_3801 [Actinoplanes sp. N902-109]|nr:hypothetical protein L083_3801 [Actinoplanes sp. N902-109]
MDVGWREQDRAPSIMATAVELVRSYATRRSRLRRRDHVPLPGLSRLTGAVSGERRRQA